jgi:hypothetical protein
MATTSSTRLPVKILVKPDNSVDLVVTRKVNPTQLASIRELDKRINNSLPLADYYSFGYEVGSNFSPELRNIAVKFVKATANWDSLSSKEQDEISSQFTDGYIAGKDQFYSNNDDDDDDTKDDDRLDNPWFWPSRTKQKKYKQASRKAYKAKPKKGFLGFGKQNIERDIDNLEDKGYKDGLEFTNKWSSPQANAEKRDAKLAIRDKYRKEYERSNVSKLVSAYDRGYSEGKHQADLDKGLVTQAKLKAKKAKSQAQTATTSPTKPKRRRKRTP